MTIAPIPQVGSLFLLVTLAPSITKTSIRTAALSFVPAVELRSTASTNPVSAVTGSKLTATAISENRTLSKVSSAPAFNIVSRITIWP